MAAIAFDTESITRERNRRGIAGTWTPDPERIPSSLTDSDQSTQQTVQEMAKQIRQALTDPLIQSIAARTSGGWGNRLPSQKCWDIFWFCKHQVRFELDERAVLALLNEVDQIDCLISPPVLMRMPRPAGDCDDFTMLACALMTLNNVACEIVTVATDRQRPREWSHVYARAILPDGRRMPIDPTNGDYPGWEVPAYDIQRMQAWDLNGNPIETLSSCKTSRLQGYQRRGVGDNGDVVVGLPDSPLQGGTTTGFISSMPSDQLFSLTSNLPTSSSSSSSIDLGSLLGTIAADTTKLVQTAILPSGSSLVGGNVISPSGAAAGAFLGVNAQGQSTLAGIPMQTLLMLGLVLAGIFVISKAAK